MRGFRRFLVGIVASALASCRTVRTQDRDYAEVLKHLACEGDPARAISASAILHYATSPYDKGALVDRRIILGRHRGALVLADYPCSDVCPDHTVRVVHYDIVGAAPCGSLGGVIRRLQVPWGIGAADIDFCFPAVLSSNWGAYLRFSGFGAEQSEDGSSTAELTR